MHPAYDDEPTVPLPIVGPPPVRRRVRRRNRPGPVGIAVGAVVVLLIGIGLLAWPAVFRPAAATGGEVYLESTTTAGRDPFTDTVIVGNPPGTKSQSPPASTVGSVTTVAGDTPALYGGSRNEKVCDRGKLVAFLEQNPDKAAAWAGVLGIPTADIATYVGTLTPVQLRADTRVTNHGYANGHATTLQSVLQAGTAVLVDDLGRPRVKCGCGNPLLEPVATPVSPVYTGEAWPDFDPARLSAVSPAAAPIATFVVHDLRTGETFTRPRGTAGEADALTNAPAVPPATSEAGPAPPDPSCPNGEVRVAGSCVPRTVSCPAGSHPSASGTSCVPDAVAPTACPAGSHRASDGMSCVKDDPAACPAGEHREGGTCVEDGPITCPAGSHPVSDGTACAKDPPVCANGTHLEGGICVPDVPVCRAGTHLEGGTCVPDKPTCQAGTHLEGDVCVKDKPTCQAGTHLEGDTCVPDKPVCQKGTHLDGNVCVPDTPVCEKGTHLDGNVCVPDTPTCREGTHLQGNVCVPDKLTCGRGFHAEGNICVPDKIIVCEKGTHLEGSTCVPDTPPTCPPGTVRDPDGTCRAVLNRRPRGRRRQLPCSSANSPRRYSS